MSREKQKKQDSWIIERLMAESEDIVAGTFPHWRKLYSETTKLPGFGTVLESWIHARLSLFGDPQFLKSGSRSDKLDYFKRSSLHVYRRANVASRSEDSAIASEFR